MHFKFWNFDFVLVFLTICFSCNLGSEECEHDYLVPCITTYEDTLINCNVLVFSPETTEENHAVN